MLASVCEQDRDDLDIKAIPSLHWRALKSPQVREIAVATGGHHYMEIERIHMDSPPTKPSGAKWRPTSHAASRDKQGRNRRMDANQNRSPHLVIRSGAGHRERSGTFSGQQRDRSRASPGW